MSHAIPTIGAHCSLASCNLNDFLPIRCACDQVFCRDHAPPDKHLCPAMTDRMASGGERATNAREKCAKADCSRPSLESAVREGDGGQERTPARCLGCGSCFCAYHREPASHSCAPAIPAAPPKNEAARQLLAKNFPSSVAKPALRVKKSANKQVAIMQMRRRAQPADPKDDRPSVNVPISDRLHVEVEVEDGLAGGSRADSPKVFWLRKTIGTGRALDSLAGRMGVSTASPLQLLKVTTTGDVVLRNDVALSDQVEDADRIRLSRRT
ncbi:hypothetical protein FOMPIDRAFT_1037970 [Fomitopsis schrenkii]|uniref:AN1-type domain-containing protein n=1 Tax=Fomitopsis schrenkii TaxID=2126942 RepID=S8DV55_FOMSC|nr:hypothetical protein FOMPIDRAFT_1037970 [Fomitopsis schrenkii]